MTTARPSETILIVDDEPTIRRLIRRMLAEQGYQVIEAPNGHEALRLASDHRDPIALLVADVVMPQMNGFTLGERLVESHPETRVLFLSGYAAQSVTVRGGLKETGHAFLLKPFTQNRLLSAISEQLLWRQVTEGLQRDGVTVTDFNEQLFTRFVDRGL